MKTIIYITEDYNSLIYIVKKCLQNNISFEFMNDNELYFTIYDDVDFKHKQSILSSEIINEKNYVS
jgi:hypothetical protein